MRKFKRVLSLVSATITMFVGVTSTGMLKSDFKVSAALNYNSCDINRDRIVDLDDATFMGQYLSGYRYMYDNSIIDVDRNSIVSYADNQCIAAKNLGVSFRNSVDGSNKVFKAFNTSNVPTTNKSIEETYVKYIYKTNTESQPYTLSLQEDTKKSKGLSTLKSNIPGIIGDEDSRVPDVNDGIVYLSTGGTGFIVGDHTIATSAHCVYDNKYKTWCNDVKVYLSDENGIADTTVNGLAAVEAHIPLGWKNSSNTKNDYALITVKENLKKKFHFNLGIPYNVYNTGSIWEKYTVYSTGFSYYIPNVEKEDQLNSYPTPQMYTGNGRVVNANNVDKNLFCYDTDITYGNSGGPVYVKETYKKGNNENTIFTAVSVCSGIVNVTSPHHNTGPVMNAIMLKFYRNNSYAKSNN